MHIGLTELKMPLTGVQEMVIKRPDSETTVCPHIKIIYKSNL